MTGTLLFANNANTTLSSGLTPSATVIAVATGTGALFPNPNTSLGQYFVATLVPASSTTGLPNEIVHITAVSGDTMTAVRGQEGTTALTWNVGDTFSNFWTAGSAAALAQQSDVQQQVGNYAADTGAANAGVITLSPVPPSLTYLTGSPIRVKKAASGQTGNYTLNINGLGATAVLLPGGGQLPSGTLSANSTFEVNFNGTSFVLLSLPSAVPISPVTNAELAAMPADTIKGNNTSGSGQPLDLTGPQLETMLGFAGNLASTGHAVIPLVISGVLQNLIINWGNATPNTSVTFDLAFPNAAFIAIATGNFTSPATYESLTKTGMNVYAGGGATNISWAALGW